MASAGPRKHFGVFKVETLLHQRVERLEQTLLYGKRQGHALRQLLGRLQGQTLQLRRGEDLAHQALGSVRTQQAFHIHAQAAPTLLEGDDSRGTSRAARAHRRPARYSAWRLATERWMLAGASMP